MLLARHPDAFSFGGQIRTYKILEQSHRIPKEDVKGETAILYEMLNLDSRPDNELSYTELRSDMFTSHYPSIDIPKQDLIDFVLGQGPSYDLSKPIFIDSDDVSRHYSLSDLKDLGGNFGAALKSKFQFQQGDVLAIFSANSIEYPLVVFGTFFTGGVNTLVNPVYRQTEVANQLRDSKAKVVFTTNELLDTALAACHIAGIPTSHVIVAADKGSAASEGTTDLIDMLLNTSNSARDILRAETARKPDDLAFLCYSSGTTGLSKGVKLSHRNLISNLLQWDAGETYLNATSSVISVLPFSHIYALNVLIMNPIRRMMSSFVMSRFHPTKFLELVQTHSITASFIVPPIVKALLGPEASKYKLSSLDFLCSGAAPLSPELARDVCQRYSLQISQGFGLTETSPVLCYARFDGTKYRGSVGKLLPNIELRIVDEDGQEQQVNGHGELQVRGPNVMSGYLNNDEANLNAFTTDGFFKTGDLGYVADDGCVYLVDRIKELIKYKGFQVPPVELENLLLTHPAILDCAVIGRNCDIEVTELPTAYCVLRPSALASGSNLPVGWADLDDSGSMTSLHHKLAREIIDFVGLKVANYKKLRGGVVFTDAIPRVPAGKILRRVLRERTGVEFIL